MVEQVVGGFQVDLEVADLTPVAHHLLIELLLSLELRIEFFSETPVDMVHVIFETL